jgi:hypothetical protein
MFKVIVTLFAAAAILGTIIVSEDGPSDHDAAVATELAKQDAINAASK